MLKEREGKRDWPGDICGLHTGKKGEERKTVQGPCYILSLFKPFYPKLSTKRGKKVNKVASHDGLPGKRKWGDKVK